MSTIYLQQSSTLTTHVSPAEHAVVTGETLRQDDGHIELASLGADLKSIAAVGKAQAMLIEALLGLPPKGIQVAQVELKVAQVVRGDLDANCDGIGSWIALGNDTIAANLAADLVGARLRSREVVAAQAASAAIVFLGLHGWNEK